MYGAHIGKIPVHALTVASTPSRQTDVPPARSGNTENKPGREEPFIFFGQKYTCKRYFGKGL